MALRQLILGRRIEEARAALEQARREEAALAQTRTALEAEEQRIAEALGEVSEQTSAEDRQAAEQLAREFDERAQAHTRQEEQARAQVRQLQEQLSALEREQAELTRQAGEAASAAAQESAGGAAQKARGAGEHRDERTEGRTMDTRTFFGMNMQQRDAFFARSDMKEFLERVRGLKAQSRDVKGGELLIPQAALPILRQIAGESSKLVKHVNLVSVRGTARQTISGTIPEAVWTEMAGKINELSISFNRVETDGYKVAGYIAVANSLLEDSDVDLAAEVFDKLGRAIGKALDMAILYGKGVKKMPLGILTRLAQTVKPETYPTTAREWKDLSESNVVAITGKTGAALFKEIIAAAGKAKNDFATGGMFWAMNHTTHMKLVAESVGFNAAGAVVAGMNDTMPIIGGAIEELSFIPDDAIIGGYEGLYLLVERAGTALAMSEHLRFLEDETVFKGTARYDGLPVIPEGFVAIGVGGVKPSADAVTFAEDKANAAV